MSPHAWFYIHVKNERGEAVTLIYNAVRPGPTRLRRKWVRRAGGRRCHRSIMWCIARSLSRARAASRARRLGGFFTTGLQNVQHGAITGTSCRALALDDVVERGDQERRPAELHACGPVAHTRERPDAMDRGHQIDLQAVLVADDAIEIRRRVIGAKDGGAERPGDGLHLLQVPRRLPKQEIKVHRGDRRSLKRRRRVADEHGLEAGLVEAASDLAEQGFSVHAPSIPAQMIAATPQFLASQVVATNVVLTENALMTTTLTLAVPVVLVGPSAQGFFTEVCA